MTSSASSKPASATSAPTDPVAIGNRRVVAAIVDVWLLTGLLTALAGQAVAIPWSVLAGAVVATVLLAAAESMHGQTPGKALAGVQVADTNGAAPTLRVALTRRSWMPLQAVAALFDPVGGLLAVGIVIALAWSVYRSPEDRGWHDRLAGTRVVGAADAVRWLKIAGVVVVVAGVGGWIWGLADTLMR